MRLSEPEFEILIMGISWNQNISIALDVDIAESEGEREGHMGAT